MAILNIRGIVVAGLGMALALAGGCNSSGCAPENVQTVESMDSVYSSLGKATAQVQRTTGYLDGLTQGVNMQETFKHYTASIEDLKKAAEDARKRGAEYREHRDEYLATWQKEAENMSNPDIKEASADRRARVAARFDEITGLADGVRGAYQPYVKDLDDIQKALALDLSPGGVKSIQPTIEAARKEGSELVKKLDALGVALDKARGKIVPAK